MGRAQRFEGHHGSPQSAAWSGARWWPEIGPMPEAAAQPITILTDMAAVQRRDADIVLLLIGVAGTASIAVGRFIATIGPGTVAIIAAGSSVSVKPIDAAGIVALRLPRARIQMLCSALDRRPCLLRHVSLLVDDPDLSLHHIASAAMARLSFVSEDAAAIADQATRRAVRLLRGSAAETIWRTSGPLERAIDLLANPADGIDPACVAGRAGITERSLQRGLQACTGLTPGQFVTEARLAAARAALSSMRETRSIGTLAHRSGFHDSSSFARAYRRRFGETPSVTRARCAASSHQ